MSQQHFVGLDVSVKETAICILDPQVRLVHCACAESDPEVIREHRPGLGLAFGRIGLDAGPLSPWLHVGLVEAERPAICVETRHRHTALSARINKADRNDAPGYRAEGAGRPVRARACEGPREPASPPSADLAHASATQGPRRRERPVWSAAQLRPQGRRRGGCGLRGARARPRGGPARRGGHGDPASGGARRCGSGSPSSTRGSSPPCARIPSAGGS